MAVSLKNKDVIKSVFLGNSRSLRSKSFIFKYNFSDLKGQHIVFIVSSKVSKSAVERNKIKRRGRYIIRKHNSSIPSGLVGAFVFNKSILKLSFAEIEKEMAEVLGSIKKR